MKPSEVKSALNHAVKYAGDEYIMTAYILRIGKDGPIHSAELRDTKANSVIIARLEEVNRVSSLPNAESNL